MKNNIIVINGPNLNLLGEREQSQYGSITFDEIKKNCLKKAKELNINLDSALEKINLAIILIINQEDALGNLLDTKAEILWKMGNSEDAIEIINQAILIDSTNSYFLQQKEKFSK